MKQRERELSRAVVATNAAMAVVALAIAAVMLIGLQFLQLRRALLDDVRTQASIVGSNSAAALMFNDAEAGTETLGALRVTRYIRQAAVFGVAGIAPLAIYERQPGPPPARPGADLLAAGYRFSLGTLEVAQRIEQRGRTVGSVLIVASLRELYLQLLIYASLILLVALAALGIAMPLLLRMKREVQRSEAHLDYLAHIDPVSGLRNRNSFSRHLRDALATCPPGAHVGLLMLDLDDFKVVNDTLGHAQGDALLRALALRLPAALERDQALYRFGGDEFAVVLPRLRDPAAAQRAGQEIMNLLARPFSVGSHEVYVKASVGAAVGPADGADLETLTRNADTAMYAAKRRGKNACVAFRPEMNQRVQHRLALERELHQALERNELLLHFQPQVRLADGGMVGVEALLRWRHPTRGLLRPDEFIGVAEHCGLIVSLGRWVLRAACRQAAAWREQGLPPLQMAVNVSVRQLREKELLADIQDALEDTGLDATQLELELTESMLLEDIEGCAALLQRIRALGVRLAIDDFGTGYSALSYLPTYHVDKLKIDRSFVRRIPGDGAPIVTAIIALARSFNLAVIAEGIEQPAQAEFLRRAGCGVGQGFLYAQALPADAIAQILRGQDAADARPALRAAD
jgi:diguanylate cyclase (GGDEF)-like protein